VKVYNVTEGKLYKVYPISQSIMFDFELTRSTDTRGSRRSKSNS